MRELLCRDAGLDCPHTIRADTDEEVMQLVGVHAEQSHPDLALTPELQSDIRALIHEA